MSLVKYIFLGLLVVYCVSTFIASGFLKQTDTQLGFSDGSFSLLNSLEKEFNAKIEEKGKYVSKCVSMKPDPECLLNGDKSTLNLRKIHSISDLTVHLGNYKVLLNPVSLCSDTPRIFIAYYVRVDQFFERYVIRKTVANMRYYNRYSIKVGFFVGVSNNNKELLAEEFEKYKDIIQFSFEDKEFQETLSFMLSLKWLNDNCECIFYFMKCDTSTFVNIHYLINHDVPILREKSYAGNGILIENEKVERDMKKPNMIYADIYPNEEYPPHFDKSFCIFTSKSLERFIESLNEVDPIYLLDEYIGILSKHSYVELNNIEGKMIDIKSLVSTTDLSDVVAVKDLSPIGLYDVWFFFKDVLAEPNGNQADELLIK